jgi:hypothetical protein
MTYYVLKLLNMGIISYTYEGNLICDKRQINSRSKINTFVVVILACICARFISVLLVVKVVAVLVLYLYI